MLIFSRAISLAYMALWAWLFMFAMQSTLATPPSLQRTAGVVGVYCLVAAAMWPAALVLYAGFKSNAESFARATRVNRGYVFGCGILFVLLLVASVLARGSVGLTMVVAIPLFACGINFMAHRSYIRRDR